MPSAGSSAGWGCAAELPGSQLPPVSPSFPAVSTEACSPARSVRKTAFRTTAWASSCRSKAPVDTDEPSELRELAVASHAPKQGEQDGNPAARHPLGPGPARRPGRACRRCQPASPVTRAQLRVQDAADHPGHGRRHPALAASEVLPEFMSKDSKALCGGRNGVYDFFFFVQQQTQRNLFFKHFTRRTIR